MGSQLSSDCCEFIATKWPTQKQHAVQGVQRKSKYSNAFRKNICQDSHKNTIFFHNYQYPCFFILQPNSEFTWIYIDYIDYIDYWRYTHLIQVTSNICRLNIATQCTWQRSTKGACHKAISWLSFWGFHDGSYQLFPMYIYIYIILYHIILYYIYIY